MVGKPRVLQVGLGRWGLNRTWAWWDVGVDLYVYDVKMPPEHRLPPGVKPTNELCSPAWDIISISVPPDQVNDALGAIRPQGQTILLEKPGGVDIQTAFFTLENLEKAHNKICYGLTALYDQCVIEPAKDVSGRCVKFTSKRLHSAGLHRGITVVEDLLVHDLAIADFLCVTTGTTNFEVSGTFPHAVRVTSRMTDLEACINHPVKVRLMTMEHPDRSWLILPEHASCTDGRVFPPGQSSALYRECSAVVEFYQTGTPTHGNADRLRSVWNHIAKIRANWK